MIAFMLSVVKKAILWLNLGLRSLNALEDMRSAVLVICINDPIPNISVEGYRIADNDIY